MWSKFSLIHIQQESKCSHKSFLMSTANSIIHQGSKTQIIIHYCLSACMLVAGDFTTMYMQRSDDNFLVLGCYRDWTQVSGCMLPEPYLLICYQNLTCWSVLPANSSMLQFYFIVPWRQWKDSVSLVVFYLYIWIYHEFDGWTKMYWRGVLASL